MPINPLAGGSDSTDDQINEQNKNQISGATTGVSTGTPSSAGGVSSAGTPAASQEQRSSGSFTNLNQYVNANADQAQGLGQKLGQGVQQSANQGLSQLNQAQQQFNTQEQAAGANPNDYTAQKVSDFGNSIINNPNNVAQSDIDAFKQTQAQNAAFQAGTDTAPKQLSDLSGYQNAKSSLDTAAQNAQLTGTESGRNQLLRQTFQNPNYSQGQTSLDQLLTQNVPQNRSTLENLRTNLLGQYGLANQENQAIQNAAGERQNVIQGTQQAANNIQTGLYGPQTDANGNPVTQQSGILSGYLQQLSAQPTNITNLQQQQYTQAQNTVADAINKAGLTGLIGQGNINSMIQQYLSEQTPATNINLQNTLTAPEIQSLQQIAQLQGDTNGNITVGNQSINPNQLTPGSVNTAPTLNAQGLTGAIQQNLNSYANTITTQVSNGLNNTVSTYGQNLPLNQAAQYAVGRVNAKMMNPAQDAKENQAVGDQLQKQIQNVNSLRQQSGFSPLDLSSISSNASQIYSQMIQQIGPQAVAYGHYEAGGLSNPQNNWYNSPWATNARAAILAAAQVQAKQQFLNQIKQNPLQGVDSGQITNPNYISGLINQQNQASNAEVNNGPAPVTIDPGTGVKHNVSS